MQCRWVLQATPLQRSAYLTSADKCLRICDLGQELGIRPCGCVTRGRGGSPSRPPRRTNHAAFFSLLMGSPRKNGRLGDPALPSLSSNSFHVKYFHPKFRESPSLALRASVWRKELQVPQKPVRRPPMRVNIRWRSGDRAGRAALVGRVSPRPQDRGSNCTLLGENRCEREKHSAYGATGCR